MSFVSFRTFGKPCCILILAFIKRKLQGATIQTTCDIDLISKHLCEGTARYRQSSFKYRERSLL